MMKRLKPLVILMFAVLVVSTTAFGEAIAGTATGKFNNSTSTLNFGYLPTGSLVYTGSPFAGTTTQAGDLTPLGSFHLNAPGGNDLFGDDIEGTFTLHLAFTAPPTAGSANFTADVNAHVFLVYKTGTVTIDFDDAPKTINHANGSFDLNIDDVTLGTLFGLSCDQTLQADITNVVTTPEPAAIMLFGTLIVGVGIWRRKRA